MLLDGSYYGKAFERLKVWWQEIVLCTTRTGALSCSPLLVDAGKLPLRLSRQEWNQIRHWFWQR